MQPASGCVAPDQMSELGSRVEAFVEQRCHLDPDQQVIKASLYRAWHAWCAEGRDGLAAANGQGLSAVSERRASEVSRSRTPNCRRC